MLLCITSVRLLTDAHRLHWWRHISVISTAAAQQMVTQLYLMDTLALQAKSLISPSTLAGCLNCSEPRLGPHHLQTRMYVNIGPEARLSKIIHHTCTHTCNWKHAAERRSQEVKYSDGKRDVQEQTQGQTLLFMVVPTSTTPTTTEHILHK